MRPIWVLAVPVFAAALREAGAQEAVFVETRFERIHLRNGSTIDGRLVREGAGGVTLALKAGEMWIRKDQIERVERVRMRTLAAAALSAPPKAAAPLRAVEEKPAEAAAPAALPVSAPADPLLERLEAASDAELPGLAKALRERGPEELAKMAERFGDLSGRSRRVLAGVLRESRSNAAIPALKRAAGGTDPEVRAEAVAVLGGFQDSSLVRDLRGFLGDPEPAVRAAAIPGLVALDDRDCFEILAELCKDPDGGVRTRAVAGAIDLAGRHNLRRDLVWALRDAVDRAEGEVKQELLSAVGRAGLRELDGLVAPLLDDPNPRIRAQAATTLAALAPREAAGLLLSRLASEREYWPRIQLAEAARTLRLRGAIPELIRWLDEDDVNLRMAATRSLREITGQSFGQDRARWNAWWASAGPR